MTLAALLLLAPPTVALPDARGNRIPLLVSGKPTVLVLGILGCPIAKGYAPELGRLAGTYRAQGVQWRFVILDGDAPSTDLVAFAKQYRIPFPILQDADHLTVTLTKAKAVPTAVLFDAQGRMRYVGRIDDRYPALGIQRKPREANLDQAIQAVLKGKNPSPARTAVVGCVIPPKSAKR
jgi:hypothetical protein